jgi:hypothetical protein
MSTNPDTIRYNFDNLVIIFSASLNADVLWQNFGFRKRPQWGSLFKSFVPQSKRDFVTFIGMQIDSFAVIDCLDAFDLLHNNPAVKQNPIVVESINLIHRYNGMSASSDFKTNLFQSIDKLQDTEYSASDITKFVYEMMATELGPANTIDPKYIIGVSKLFANLDVERGMFIEHGHARELLT